MSQFDFSALREGKLSYADTVAGIDFQELRSYIEQVFEAIDGILKDATDAAVRFVPHDPQAAEDSERGWNIGHIIAHLTASIEENAAVSSILARGLTFDGRLYVEVPWESITTVEQVRARLKESRRISLAYLEAWPDQPRLDTTVARIPAFGPMTAVGIYMLGIFHAQMHYEQLRETLRQGAKSASA